ncbi:hypothetical protein THAOC_02181 [Thalassiosira oceanica]|uniref:Enoyl reductase (ER) domain-containing protein n=1 Tax=Thalassiosira oceanica TaxID=159749 RepID=K0TGA0_THAOC|nr:hypothetical protein THAOC_02181 [Thalassiosira oceanica]|eukprot:EJK76074.1 hypothetical protein THAOC_02181 [Thalassiosira oceanica]
MATGVCRSDWHGWAGHDDDIKNHGFPFVPGHEVSGLVVEVGEEVAVPFILSCGTCHTCCYRNRPTICEKQEQPGFTMLGSFAEYLALPRADRNLSVIPAGVDFSEAAALGCRFTTAYRAVIQQGKLSIDDVISVHGCGGLGMSCIMIAKARGCRRIIAIDVSDDALRKAKDELGATDTINARDEDVLARVLEITGGRGADVAVDAAGFKQTCEGAIHSARRGGTVVQVGLPIGDVKPIVPMGMVAGRELQIIGSHGADARDMPSILELVRTGKLDPKKLIEREVTLEEGAAALMDMDKGSPLGMLLITKFAEEPKSLL